MRLRQIAFVAEDLEPRTDELCGVLGLQVGFRDPGVGLWGLHNIVAPIGGNFLEIVSPTTENTSAGRYLKRRDGDGGYMVILLCADAVAQRERIAGLGVRVVHEIDRPAYIGTHFHPQDTGGVLLSVDSVEPGADYLDPFCSWEPGGPDWKDAVRTDVSSDLLAAEIQSEDPAALAARWSEILALPAHASEVGQRIDLEQGHLRFVGIADGRPAGLGAIDVKVADVDKVTADARSRGLPVQDNQVMLCGTRVNLV